MSFHTPDSDLARLRRAPVGMATRVDPHTVKVLRLAEELYTQTCGLFDVTAGRALVRSGFLPSPEPGGHALFPGTAADIELLDDRNVRCRRPTLIDLGGIAKGYAVDFAVETLVAAGVEQGLVNAGGDLRIFGTWARPVHVRSSDGRLAAAVMLRDRALATSENGACRRFGRGKWQTPHIGAGGTAILLDRPVSVIAPTCVIADAMTKIAMSDAELADRLLARCGGHVVRHVEALTAA